VGGRDVDFTILTVVCISVLGQEGHYLFVNIVDATDLGTILFTHTKCFGGHSSSIYRFGQTCNDERLNTKSAMHSIQQHKIYARYI